MEKFAQGPRERVFALPTVHFYTRGLGRINRFTLTRQTVMKRMRLELDRYLGDAEADGKAGHLQLLNSLGEDSAAPLVRYTGLVSVLQALSAAETYVQETGGKAEEEPTDAVGEQATQRQREYAHQRAAHLPWRSGLAGRVWAAMSQTRRDVSATEHDENRRRLAI